MARCATMFLLAGAAALRGHRLHHLARPSRTVMSAATLDRTTPTKLQDAEAFLKDIDVFIFDCDGVIWKGDSLIDKVPSVLELLRKLGKKIFFVTNNSTKSRKGYKGKFTEARARRRARGDLLVVVRRGRLFGADGVQEDGQEGLHHRRGRHRGGARPHWRPVHRRGQGLGQGAEHEAGCAAGVPLTRRWRDAATASRRA